MIISSNPKPELCKFKQLMSATDLYLNNDALVRPKYYAQRTGHLLEQDVFRAVCECAKGTPFQDTIQLVSGSKFPDIVACKYYGIEVKSTSKDHWTSIGSSILESTRIEDVERIFLTFGKLGGNPILFLSRPYEECMAGISVTHYPRYQIDMRLSEGETIFDKIGISYDELRQMENPVEPVSQYYRSQLKSGERLWWTSSNIEEAAPAKLRLWTTLTLDEKRKLIAQGYVLFPELLSGDYSNYALWLVTAHGIVHTHIRDDFSAGGQVELMISDGRIFKMPATFGRIKRYKRWILDVFSEMEPEVLAEHWGFIDPPERSLGIWCNIAALKSKVDRSLARKVLRTIFDLEE